MTIKTPHSVDWRRQAAVKPLLVPIREAFVMLGVGPTKGYELVNAGLLDVRKMGKRSLATMASVERCADGLPRFGAIAGTQR